MSVLKKNQLTGTINLSNLDSLSNESMEQYYDRMHSMGINLENCMCIKCQNQTHDFSENNNKKLFYKKLLIFSLILSNNQTPKN